MSDNKGFFRIIDFTDASRLLDEWDIPDKPPVQIEEPLQPFNNEIKGKITDKLTNEPIYNAKIKIKVGRWYKETFSDINGYFTIEDLPSNNRLNLSISHLDYMPYRKSIMIRYEEFTFELKNQIGGLIK